MFRNFTNRLSSAFRGDDDKVQTLQAMGFDETSARNALTTTSGDLDRAAELLLASSPPSMTTNTTPTSNQDDQTDDMHHVMKESLQLEEERRIRAAQEASVQIQDTNGRARTAVGTRAAEAAARRAAESEMKFGTGPARQKKPAAPATKTKPKTPFSAPSATATQRVRSTSGGLSTHHPGVKVPAKLQDKTKEEQVLRCADRVKSYPAAVDTLYRALVALQKDPSKGKYRKIDKSSSGYRRTLENVPGAEGLLLAMNFIPRGTSDLVMDRARVDQALLYLGISALEGVKQRDEYKEAKRKADFAKEVKAIQSAGDSSEEEAIKRARYMAMCPGEPSEGRGALMQVLVADETVRRRFDGDDVLADVLNWIGGHGSVIPDKILNRDWCLVDLNRYPTAPIDCANNKEKTLQFIGCWPSGRLEIRPSTDEWREGNVNVRMGSSRGLGSAPTEALH